MTKYTLAAVGATVVSAGSGNVYLRESFDDGWRERWVDSEWKKEDGTDGKWELSAGTWFADETRDRGLQTGEDSKFFGISTEFDAFSNRDKDLVVQYQMKHDQKIECGGGYLKVGPKPEDLKAFGDPTPYYLMFGPDQCGSTNRIHVILNYKGKNHLKKDDIYFSPSDRRSHLLTLVIRPDNSYTVSVDMEEKHAGNLKDDFDFLPPKQIKDPEQSKPTDWIDDPMMDDPEDEKPEDWDAPERIVDPEATMPEDWDEEEDGEWEAPMIANEDYKGEWKAKRIENPDYKGPWEHPMIENPEYYDDDTIYAFDDIAFAGFDLWQVKGGTIFDNILITDSVEEANSIAEETWKPLNEAEARFKAEEDAEAERKRKEEEEKREAEEDAELDLEDDDDL
jgi:calreticulin